jgi:phage shock protein A
MFKSLIARMRKRETAVVALDDRHPLRVLDRQRIDAEGRLDMARRQLAVATAAREAEAGRLAATDRRIAALEYRAMQALAEGRAMVARQSADMIARLSADRLWTLAALRSCVAETGRLAEQAAIAESQVGQVQRAGRVARAEEVVRQLRASAERWRGPDISMEGPLAEAEAALARLRARQAEALAREPVLAANKTEAVDVALPASTPSAAEVLVALRNRVTMARSAA